MITILKEVRIQELRWVVINAYITHHTWDTKGAHTALKHCRKVLSTAERNRLQHALNGNIDIPIATFAMAILAGITYLMKRNRTMVIEPRYDAAGVLIGARQVTANPSIAEITEENVEAEAAAQTVGAALAEIVNNLRNEHRAHAEALQRNQQEFEERLATAERRRNEEEWERARLRPRLPELKVDPPDYYEGDPTEIDAWLRKMAYYFVQV